MKILTYIQDKIEETPVPVVSRKRFSVSAFPLNLKNPKNSHPGNKHHFVSKENPAVSPSVIFPSRSKQSRALAVEPNF